MNHSNKRNLHILHDDKFTDGAIEQFEKYYPNQNIYVVLLNPGTQLKYTSSRTAVNVFAIRDPQLKTKLYDIVRNNAVKNLFVHYLDDFKAGLANKILDIFPLKFYWIFYGGDLYGYLQRYRNYNILDHPHAAPKEKPLERAVKNI